MLMHFKKLSIICSVFAFLASCGDSSPPSGSGTVEDLKQDILGKWINSDCWVDFDSNSLRENEAIEFKDDNTYVYHLSVYSATDGNCSGNPIGRLIESGTYQVGNLIPGSIPAGAYEIDFTVNQVQTEGDALLVRATNFIESVLPKTYYEVVAFDGIRLQLSFDLAESSDERGSETDTVLDDIVGFNQTYLTYQQAVSYEAPTAAQLAGDWVGNCYSPETTSLYLHESYTFTLPDTFSYTISVASEDTCTNILASIEYTGVYSQDGTLDLPAPWNVTASSILLQYDNKTETGNVLDYQSELNPIDSFPVFRRENMLLNPSRGLLLESNGAGDAETAAPLNLEIVYRAP